jgi:hypothetical protein
MMYFGHKHAREHITDCSGTYMCVLMRIPYGVSHKHAHRHTKIMYFGHKHAHEHITGCWYIYVRVLMRIPIWGVS